jgi:hypothetical protein
MNSNNKMSAITKFRGPSTMHMRQHPLKVLVIYDVQVKTAEVSQIPLIVNYGMFTRCTAHLSSVDGTVP